jgi:hypothetical protein
MITVAVWSDFSISRTKAAGSNPIRVTNMCPYIFRNFSVVCLGSILVNGRFLAQWPLKKVQRIKEPKNDQGARKDCRAIWSNTKKGGICLVSYTSVILGARESQHGEAESKEIIYIFIPRNDDWKKLDFRMLDNVQKLRDTALPHPYNSLESRTSYSSRRSYGCFHLLGYRGM